MDKKLRTSPSSSSLITHTKEPETPLTNVLHISDTKTRGSYRIPSDDEARQSRLQLMLYHQLLTSIISPSFDFNNLWTTLHLDPLRTLTDQFLVQTQLIALSNCEGSADGPPTCLRDLVAAFTARCEALDAPVLDATLELVYRSREDRAPREFRRRSSTKHELQDFQRAIEASLLDTDPDLARAIQASLETQPPSPGYGKTGMGDDINVVLPAFVGATLERDGATFEKTAVTLESGGDYLPKSVGSTDELAHVTYGFTPDKANPSDAEGVIRGRKVADEVQRTLRRSQHCAVL
jgi:hypothetical protein